jgi:ribosomal peptide maturation radical SAM protein 1
VIRNTDQRVAFVYPPFGPAGLPSLGLALLTASVKTLGFECRTFYWNLQFLNRLPGESMSAKMRTYWWLTQRTWHPFSEWMFARIVHDDALAAGDATTLAELEERAREAPQHNFGARDLLALREQAEDLVEEAMEQVAGYQIVGIASTFFQNLPALALARRIKQRWPDKCVVLGGANCDGPMGPALLRNFPFVDHVLCGEADAAFPEFLRRRAAGEPLSTVGGVLSRRSGGSVSGEPAAPVATMDELPLPDFEDFVEQRERFGAAGCQQLVLALESSRGCWWGAKQHCVFCGLNANGMGYRRKSEERFRWELRETVRRYSAKFVFMTDNILPVEYHERVGAWREDLAADVRLFYEIKSNARRPQVKGMADAGITAVQPGIESFSSPLLALMKKGVTAAQNVAFLRYAREYGIRVGYNLLAGFPGGGRETYADMIRSLPRLAHLHPPSGVVPIEFHRFSPYHQNPQAFGLKLRASDAYSRLYPFPESEIAELAYMFYAERPEDEPDLLEELNALVTRWRRAYAPEECTLTWQEAGEFIVIQDRRPGFGPRSYRLQAYARDVFRQLDEPHGLNTLVRAARLSSTPSETQRLLDWLFAPEPYSTMDVIAFEAGDFIADPVACLKPMLQAGLLFEDVAALPEDMTGLGSAPAGQTRYVALPVHASYRAEDVSWNSTGV